MPVNNPNIPIYSANDLLRYATGQMAASEMYALEKAALEDPFLAEAIEGYMTAAASNSQPVLQKSIDKLTPAIAQKEEQKAIPLWRRKIFQYAAAAAIVLGGGWFTYSIINQTEKEQNIALVPKSVQQNDVAKTDTVNANMAATEKPVINQAPASNAEQESYANATPPDKAMDNGLVMRQKQVETNNAAPIVQDSIIKEKTDNTTIAKDELAQQEQKPEPVPGTIINATTADETDKYRSAAKKDARAFSKSSINSTARYVFHGRITDAKNNPLPYANVMISGEDIGTYTDTKGNFNFIYDDSILPVRTRSLGYESQTVQMKPGNREQQIIMPEDEKLKESLELRVQKPMAKQSGYKPLIVETDSLSSAQPVVSLFDYNTYLLNNNRINLLPQTGSRSVELSFEVDKRGELKNITVEQSSGKELDDEAIRLLKEGPKWKSIKNNGKARVKVKL